MLVMIMVILAGISTLAASYSFFRPKLNNEDTFGGLLEGISFLLFAILFILVAILFKPSY